MKRTIFTIILSMFILVFVHSQIMRPSEVFPDRPTTSNSSVVAQSGAKFSPSEVVEIFLEEMQKDTFTNLLVDYEGDRSSSSGKWQVNVCADGYSSVQYGHVGEVSIYLRIRSGYIAFRTFEKPTSIRDGLVNSFYMFKENEFEKQTEDVFINFFKESFTWAKRNNKPYTAAEFTAFDKLISSFYSDERTLLMLMAEVNADVAVQQICNSYGGLNSLDAYGWTALMYAASKNSLDSARILLNAGADIGIKDADGQTALAIASAKNYTDMVKLLKGWQQKYEQEDKVRQQRQTEQEKEKKQQDAYIKQLQRQAEKNMSLKEYYDALKKDMDAEIGREKEQLDAWRSELH